MGLDDSVFRPHGGGLAAQLLTSTSHNAPIGQIVALEQRSLLESFLDRRVRDVERRPSSAQVDPGRALRVDRVADPSVAARAGIEPGDVLVRVGRHSAAALDFDSLLDPDADLHWDFLSPARGERVRLASTGVPLGIELAPTTEVIVARFADDTWELEDLDHLWVRGAWAELESCCLRFEKPGWIARFVRKRRGDPAYPTRLLLGASLIETGRRDEGMRLVREFMPDENYHTLQYHSIGRYYLGLDADSRADRAGALRWLEEAFRQKPFDRIADRIETWTGHRPQDERSRFEGGLFPVDYRLPRLEGQNLVDLGETLASLSRGQILPVVLLATYRANGPYSDLMKVWTRLSLHMRELIPRLHVITMESERRSDRPSWMEGENRAREHGCPFDLLHDSDGEVTMTCAPAGSPWVLLLDRTGRVLGEGGLEEVAVWEALAAAS